MDRRIFLKSAVGAGALATAGGLATGAEKWWPLIKQLGIRAE
jgi:hypothetical protein